jgi:hypothetical protein
MEIAVVICASRRCLVQQKRLLTKFPAKIDADLVNNFNGTESHIKAALCQDRQKSRLQLIADIRLVNPAR